MDGWGGAIACLPPFHLMLNCYREKAICVSCITISGLYQLARISNLYTFSALGKLLFCTVVDLFLNTVEVKRDGYNK